MQLQRVKPGPGQESVWEYPRPPVVQPEPREVEVILAGSTIARTKNALRVLETGNAPVYYVPSEDVLTGALLPADRVSYCDFKGEACYYHVISGDQRVAEAAWTYSAPRPGYEMLADHIAFYPAAMDRCVVGGEVATPQPGAFRGGWVTSDVVGPFIGEPGVLGSFALT